MPATPASFAILRQTDLFRAFSDEELADFSEAFREERARAGAMVVHEGDEDRALFVVAGGRARVVSDGVHLGTIDVGQHFGEVALIAGGTRTASVVADTDLTLLVLESDAFEAFAESHARLAIRALREIVSSTSSRLARMNETVGLLLRQRGLPRRVDVRVTCGDGVRTCRNGTPAMELLPEAVGDAPVVAALIDGRARPLNAPITGDCVLAPLTTEHWEGQRIYRRSLALALLEAAQRVGIAIRVGPSLGFAQRILLEAGADPAGAADMLERSLGQLVEADAPLVLERLGVLEAVDYFERMGWYDAARLVETTRHTAVPLVSYGEAFVLGGGALLPSTGRLSVFSIVPDEDGLLLVYSVPGSLRDAPDDMMERERDARDSGLPPVDIALEARDVSRHTVQMTQQQERFLGAMGIDAVGDFNHACIDGEVGQLIRVAEGFHEKSIGRIADALAEKGDAVKLVCIAGPSSSGKTTFIRRLSVQLQVNGLNPKGLGLDDYYVDRDATPKDDHGEYDFETVDALKLDLLSDHLSRLTAGQEVTTAHFDFRTGLSHPEGGPTMRLEDRDILMLEGIHGLNPRLYASLPAERIFRIFVCPLVQLPFDRVSRMHASDVRLLRRIVRDRHGRSKTAAETILRWPSVRTGERKHIFPFQGNADAVFDTSLVYEISVLKVYAERYLLEVPAAHPAQTTAERLLALLDRWVTIYPDHVPPTSILREFIGGSGFSY